MSAVTAHVRSSLLTITNSHLGDEQQTLSDCGAENSDCGDDDVGERRVVPDAVGHKDADHTEGDNVVDAHPDIVRLVQCGEFHLCNKC